RKPGARPVALRPGPRLNIRPSARLRPGLTSAAPTESSSDAPVAETPASEAPATESDAENPSHILPHGYIQHITTGLLSPDQKYGDKTTGNR
ncbi:jg2478, partial [Pararge aegeria aegeria]